MLVDLAQLFRAVLKADDKLVPITQEIELGRRYLDIEQVRLGDRMTVNFVLPPELPELKVPQLLLQPLLENAVYHGIQPSITGGFITITLTQKTAGCLLEIRNSKDSSVVTDHGNHMAQANIRARLEAISDESQLAELRIEDSGQHYMAQLYLPQAKPDGEIK